jgi:hypothetical protein
LTYLCLHQILETGEIDFDKVAFSLNKVPIGNLERLNTSSNTYVVGQEIHAFPSTTFLIGEVCDFHACIYI